MLALQLEYGQFIWFMLGEQNLPRLLIVSVSLQPFFSPFFCPSLPYTFVSSIPSNFLTYYTSILTKSAVTVKERGEKEKKKIKNK